MAARSTIPRSIREATRFTSTTPHACSKAASVLAFASVSGAGSASARPPAPSPGRVHGETAEQRVARLRRQHDAARAATLSQTDRVIAAGRSMADVAHKAVITVIVGVSVISLIFTVFIVYDMTKFNRNRRREFDSSVTEFRTGSLQAARLAFIDGSATDDQVAMVEAANRAAEAAGERLPPLLTEPAERTIAENVLGRAAGQAHAGGEQQRAGPVMGSVSSAYGDGRDGEKGPWSGEKGDQNKPWWRWWR